MQKRFAQTPSLKEKSQMRNQKSLQRQSEQVKVAKNDTLNFSNKLTAVFANGMTTKYHLLLRQPFKINPTDALDQTCLWRCNLPVVANCRKKMIAIRQLQYIIPQWSGDGYPNVIYVNCDSIQGYRDAYGLVSNHIAALQITQISPSIDDTGVRTTDLKYNLKSPVSWTIPIDLAQLRLSVTVDTDTVSMILPLPNTMVVSLDLIYE